ncbi:MAG: hypothetical protein ABI810_10480 [Sphingomonas bacterium]
MNEKKVPRSSAIARWALLESGAGAAIMSNGVMQAATGNSTNAEQVTSDD